MTRDEQLEFCRVCKNQKFDPKIGTICNLTDRVADFDGSCAYYEEDQILKEKLEENRHSKLTVLNAASQAQRFSNYLLDQIFLLIFGVLFGYFMGIILAIVAPNTLEMLNTDNKLISYLLGFIVGIIYFTTFEFTTGRTPAKYITQTKVVDENGNAPTLGKILLRSVCRFIPFEPLSFLGTQPGWHDRFSKTSVVTVNDSR